MIFRNLSSTTISAAAALAFVATLTPVQAQATQAINRVAGSSRIETAAAAGMYQRSNADTVILATSGDWPDALASTVLANDKEAPLLLTDKNSVPKSTLDAIRKLKAKKVIVLGGQAAISEKVVTQLKRAKLTVERLSGAGRAETAAQVALAAGPAESGQIVIAPGWGEKAWTNAIAASALGASENKVPTLLVTKDQLPKATVDAIGQLKPNTAVVVGGQEVISDAVMSQLQAMGVRTTRVSSHSQYDLSAKVLSQNWDAFSSTANVVYASGESFADGLAAGALAAHINAPMVLVPKDYLGSATTGLLRNWNSPIQKGVIVGGSAATSTKVEQEIMNLLNEGVTSGEQSQTTISDDEYEAMLAEIDINAAPKPGASTKPSAKPTEKPSEDIQLDDAELSGDVLSVEYGKATYYTDTRVAEPGGKFDGTAMAAAHKTLPFGSLVRVTNEKNGKQVVVRINDRGPYVKGRVIDLTHAAAREIDMMKAGVVPVKLEVLRRGK